MLFLESAATVRETAANPKHLGAEPGMVGVLHTWTEAAAHGTSGGRKTGEHGR